MRQYLKMITGLTIQLYLCTATAQSPGMTGQAVSSVAETKATMPPTGAPVAKKSQQVTTANHQLPQHPNLTSTAKSVFTPAGVPMKWGGIGFAGDVFNRYPTSNSDTWSGGATAVVPFGDSDKIIGAAIALNNPDMGKNTKFGRNGTFALSLSRWLGDNTIAAGGIANMVPWGGLKDASKSYYGAVTQMFGATLNHAYHPMSVSFGLGTGSFAPLGKLDAAGQLISSEDNDLYPFVNAAFNITQDLAIAGDYYSETFAVGLSYNKVIILPFSFMLYAANLNHTVTAPSTTYGFRVATGFEFPSRMR